jgi:uncharacterized membrane protein
MASVAEGTMPSAATTKAASVAAAVSGRLDVIDAMRGIAILSMSLRHTAYFLRYPLQAETYGGQPARLLGWPYWVSGLIANISAPTFFFLIGLSLALFVNGRRKAGESEQAISRFLLTRAAVLVFLDMTVCEIAWAGPRPYTHVLLSIAIAMAILSFARLWHPAVLTLLSLLLVILYQIFLPVITPQFSETADFWMALLFSYTTIIRPASEFSILGWLALPMLGFVLGQYVHLPTFRRPRIWLVMGAGLLVIWFIVRATNVLNEPTPFVADQEWLWFFIMSKTPPSLTFLTFNLGLSALMLAALYLVNDWLQRPPGRWLIICGQASLFFFVAHIVVYGPMTSLAMALHLPGPPIIYTFIIWFIGLAILIPLAYYYRQVRRRNPRSFLRYL